MGNIILVKDKKKMQIISV